MFIASTQNLSISFADLKYNTHCSIAAAHGVIIYIVFDFTDDLSSSSSTLTQLLTKNNFCMDVTSPGMCLKVILTEKSPNLEIVI